MEPAALTADRPTAQLIDSNRRAPDAIAPLHTRNSPTDSLSVHVRVSESHGCHGDFKRQRVYSSGE
jgi:hypothetical protein